jgi:diguanylate cyclase (GGDEF)-like protein/PAS domain S-box-containing protein
MATAKILIVEDESIVAEDIKSSLQNMGYDVPSIAPTGEEAVKKAREIRPDLVLMDIVLRGDMNGIEAAGKIISCCNIPVIYLTAYSDMDTLDRAKITEPFGYIVKPFNERELHSAIEIAFYKHRMEKALRESHMKYQALFENAADAIFLIDSDTQKVLECNKKASESTGYAMSQIRTMTVAELFPAEEQEVISNIFSKITKMGALSGISGINQLRKDGQLVPVEINATTIHLEGKKYSLCIFRDITERKQAEETIQHEKNKLISILKTMEDGVYIVNQQHDIEYVNPVFKKEFGSVEGRKCHDYFHGRKTICPMCKNKEIFAGKTVHWEWIYHSNGKTYDVIDTPLKNPDGSISKLSILRDITDRKKMEEQLQAASVTDELTGIFNRRGFLTICDQQCKLADRTKKRMSLLYLDLNNLKTINDNLGHRAGDQALLDTVDLLEGTFRKSDIIARIGGDEFAVLLTEHSQTDIENVIVSNLRENLKIHNERAGRKYELSFSTGISHYDPEHPCSIGDLLNQADTLMYKDKKQYKFKEQVTVPLKEERKERRTYKRFRTGTACRAELENSGKIRIKDISFGGICLKTSQQMTLNNSCKIRIHTTNDEELALTGNVVWSSFTGTVADKNNLPSYESGIKFARMNRTLTSSLEKFVRSLAGSEGSRI